MTENLTAGRDGRQPEKEGSCTILFSNLGYAKGIDGSLWQHVRGIGRHFYCSLPVQIQVMTQLKDIIAREQPDLCCFVEIDQGSFSSRYLNQMSVLVTDDYKHYDVSGKYGENSLVGRMPLHQGRSNGFIARRDFSFEKLYFRHGTKRLVYSLRLPDDVRLFFAHFSLHRDVRMRQFQEMRDIVCATAGEVIILADFNIMSGFTELASFLTETGLVILNREDEYTFTFHRRRLALDLCLCSASLAQRLEMRVIPQPYSDHAALLVSL